MGEGWMGNGVESNRIRQEKNLYFSKYSRSNCRKYSYVSDQKDELICSANK